MIEVLKQELHNEAKEKYKNITPCCRTKGFEECYQMYNNRIFFFFNDEKGSTRALYRNLPEDAN